MVRICHERVMSKSQVGVVPNDFASRHDKRPLACEYLHLAQALCLPRVFFSLVSYAECFSPIIDYGLFEPWVFQSLLGSYPLLRIVYEDLP
jgi:hypothetical protein